MEWGDKSRQEALAAKLHAACEQLLEPPWFVPKPGCSAELMELLDEVHSELRQYPWVYALPTKRIQELAGGLVAAVVHGLTRTAKSTGADEGEAVLGSIADELSGLEQRWIPLFDGLGWREAVQKVADHLAEGYLHTRFLSAAERNYQRAAMCGSDPSAVSRALRWLADFKAENGEMRLAEYLLRLNTRNIGWPAEPFAQLYARMVEWGQTAVVEVELAQLEATNPSSIRELLQLAAMQEALGRRDAAQTWDRALQAILRDYPYMKLWEQDIDRARRRAGRAREQIE